MFIKYSQITVIGELLDRMRAVKYMENYAMKLTQTYCFYLFLVIQCGSEPTTLLYKQRIGIEILLNNGSNGLHGK